MKLNKVLLTTLSLVLVATIAIGSTLAYFTDRDSKTNVFTVGNVSIELNEDFEQGATLIPGVDIEKKPTITNTGKNDAWVWATIAIPSVLDGGNDASMNVVHFNYDKNVVNDTQWTWQDSEGWMVEEAEINDIKYSVYTVLYQTALKSGEETPAVMTKVYLDANIDINTDGNWYHVENGEVTGPYWNSETNGAPVIYVSAYAMQTEGFATVQDAYTAYQAQWGDKGTAEYVDVVDEPGITEGGEYNLTNDVYTVDTGYFHTQKVTEDVTINGNGATVEGIASSADAFTWEGGTFPAMSPIFSSQNGDLVTVNDLTFTGTMSAVMAGNYVNTSSDWFNTEFNNVNIIDAEVVSFSGGVAPALAVYGKLTMNNCVVKGTTMSELDTAGDKVCDMAITNGSTTTVNGGEIGTIISWAKTKLELNNATVGTIAPIGNMNTSDAYGIYINAGTTVDTIDLSAIASTEKVKITIAKGATVNKIVDNGQEYDSILAWAAAQ